MPRRVQVCLHPKHGRNRYPGARERHHITALFYQSGSFSDVVYWIPAFAGMTLKGGAGWCPVLEFIESVVKIYGIKCTLTLILIIET